MLASLACAAAIALSAGPAVGEDAWQLAPAPPPTAWARAGARSWRLCDELGRQALGARLQGNAVVRGSGEERVWRKRAQQCPHEPEVLVIAAKEQLLEAAQATWTTTSELDEVVQRHRDALELSLRLLAAALTESARRGEPPPIETRHLRARVSFALGRYDDARVDWLEARATADADRWQLERLGALLELLDGELEAAVRLAHAAMIDAPSDERMVSRYIWALVLDRSGAPAAASDELLALHRENSHTIARRELMSLLPIHERIYLRAIEHQANGERSNALRLWEAYLERPEPIEADRELARRHLLELSPPPVPIGGPMG